jgi:ribosomal protein L29
MADNHTDKLNTILAECIDNQPKAQKQLFDLRLKKATRQSFKPHLFKHNKRKVAQLLTLESQKKQSIK